MQVLSLAGTAEKQAASALVLLRLGSHSARLLAQTDCTPGGQKEEMFHWPEGELQKLEGLLLNLVEGLAVGILASDHYKLHTVCEEPLAMAVLRRQAAGSPDIQAEVAHKEAPREYAGLHSLYSPGGPGSSFQIIKREFYIKVFTNSFCFTLSSAQH